MATRPIETCAIHPLLACDSFSWKNRPSQEATIVREGPVSCEGKSANIRETLYYDPDTGHAVLSGHISIPEPNDRFDQSWIEYAVAPNWDIDLRRRPDNKDFFSSNQWVAKPLGRIPRVLVRPNDRGKGTGRWLVERAEQRMRCYGARKVSLLDLEESGQFWPRLGYKGRSGAARTKML
jgi:GNAT superfamily N-acetyltransferase